MLRNRFLASVAWTFLVLTFPAIVVLAQTSRERDEGPVPPPYRGVHTFMDGVFVTPVPNAPLSAVVEQESTQVLQDGNSVTRKTIAHIARDSQGRIYNERRLLMASSFTGVPPLLSTHIYDPQTRLSTFFGPFTHIARQLTLPAPAATPMPSPAAGVQPRISNPQEENLGTNTMEGVLVQGVRTTRTIPATVSGTGREVVVTDEYWYSEELRLNMLVKHNDPRTGQQTVTITKVNRSEPDAALFQVPAGYKIVDETPAN